MAWHGVSFCATMSSWTPPLGPPMFHPMPGPVSTLSERGAFGTCDGTTLAENPYDNCTPDGAGLMLPGSGGIPIPPNGYPGPEAVGMLNDVG